MWLAVTFLESADIEHFQWYMEGTAIIFTWQMTKLRLSGDLRREFKESFLKEGIVYLVNREGGYYWIILQHSPFSRHYCLEIVIFGKTIETYLSLILLICLQMGFHILCKVYIRNRCIIF